MQLPQRRSVAVPAEEARRLVVGQPAIVDVLGRQRNRAGAGQADAEGALERTSGNVSQSARALGLTRRGLYLKMDRLGIDYKVSTAGRV